MDGLAAARSSSRGRRRPARGRALRVTARAGGTAASSRRSGATCRRCASASGDERAVAVCRASEDAVDGDRRAGATTNGVDAWYPARADAPRRDDRVAARDRGTRSSRACAELGAPDEVAPPPRTRSSARCASPLFRAGALYRLARPCSRRDSRSGCARGCSSAACASTSTRRCAELRPATASPTTARGRVRASAAVLAVNARHAGLRRATGIVARRRLEPHRADRAGAGRARALGWTGGEAIADCRTLLHYFRTTERRPDRASAGAAARMGFGGAPRAPPRGRRATSLARTRASLVRFFPQLAGRADHARLGRADRRLPHPSADLRQPRTRPPRLRLHRQRRRPELPRRRDPRPARARPARRA